MLFLETFFQLTCTAEQAADPEHVCEEENALYLWAWYFLSSIAFSGIIMKLTKTTMGTLTKSIVISGPPAVGKTTVAKGLAEEFQLNILVVVMS